jgi:transposase
MVFKKKWTKRRSASTKEPGFVEGSRLTDFGFTHVKNNFDPAKPRVGENTITFLAKKTGASRATITRAVKMEYTVSSLPSKRMKRAAPKVSKERLKMMNQRREWVMVLVERTATEVRTRFQPKRKKVSSTQTITFHPFDNPARIRLQLQKEFNLVKLSAKTVRNDLQHLGYKSVAQGKCPALTPDDKAFRVTMMTKYIQYDWSKYVFVDEKIFNTNATGNRHTWIKCGSPRPTGWPQDQNPEQLVVFGAMGKGFRFFYILPRGDSMTAVRYIEHCLKGIKDHLLENDLILVQDGSNVHNSAEVLQYIKETGIQQHVPEIATSKTGRKALRYWPPRSPDLNPIENWWAVLQRMVAEKRVYSREDLERELKLATSEEVYPAAKLERMAARFDDWARQAVESGGELVS